MAGKPVLAGLFVVSFMVPAAAILSNVFLAGSKWELPAFILKYVFLFVYLVAGIIPGVIINGFYMLYSLISEDASIAAAIYSTVFAPLAYDWWLENYCYKQQAQKK